MVFNEDRIIKFQKQYDVYNLEHRVGFNDALDAEVAINMGLCGFGQMLDQLSVKDEKDFVTEVNSFDSSDGDVVVVKIKQSEIDIDRAQKLYEEIANSLPDKTIIMIPDWAGIELFDVDILRSIRDKLNDTINNLCYDNVMGFGGNYE